MKARKIHFAKDTSRTDIFPATIVACGVYASDPLFHRTHLATGDRTKVTCKDCNGTHAPKGRKRTGTW